MADSDGDLLRPATLEEAIEAIDRLLPEETKAQLLLRSEQTLYREHWGLGHWIRNTLGLWNSETPLTAWFGARGYLDADSMSGELLRDYWRHLHGLPPRSLDDYPNRFAGLEPPPSDGT